MTIHSTIRDELFESEFDGIYCLPILHNRVEFADRVRLAIDRLRPSAVAVELPETLSRSYRRAVERLPQLSIILYTHRDGTPIYLPVEPTDAIAEAVRRAGEHGIPVHYIDVDVDYDLRHHEPLPDSYAVQTLGLREYYQKVDLALRERQVHPLDLRRETGMAYHLQRLSERYERILFVCGMAHLVRVKQYYQMPQTTPLAVVRRERVRVYNLDPESAREVSSESGFLMAVYEARRKGLPTDPPRAANPKPDKTRGPFKVISGGRNLDDREADQLRSIDFAARRVHKPSDQISPESSPLDRRRLQRLLLHCVRERYTAVTGEEMKPWQKRLLNRFALKYARFEQQLVPDLYHLLVSARGAVDDNFCYELWDLGTGFPAQKQVADLPTISISGEELMLDKRRIKIRRRLPRRKKRSWTPARKRKREQRPGAWREQFDEDLICSYPPEDLVIENYGLYLKRKGVAILSEERVRVQPFQTSMLDGIDLRETIRNWHEGKIYVREIQKISGAVGSVVVIFDDDLIRDRYPFKMTWHGENDQESDMAFYSTALDEQIVGPGISRCEYGGFLLSHPPLRLAEVWSDPDYQAARSKAEKLLMAGLDYSEEKLVVYVAANPPRSIFHSIAGRWDRKIVYIPIGQLSPITLKKIRVFHILSGVKKRETAKEFIW